MNRIPITQITACIFSLFIFIYSINNYGGISEYGAGFMPTILSFSLFAFSFIDGSFTYFKQEKYTEIKDAISKSEYYSILIIALLIIFYIITLDYFGFILVSFVFLFILMQSKIKKLLLSFMISIITSTSIYYIFAKILLVALPIGAIWE